MGELERAVQARLDLPLDLGLSLPELPELLLPRLLLMLARLSLSQLVLRGLRIWRIHASKLGPQRRAARAAAQAPSPAIVAVAAVMPRAS